MFLLGLYVGSLLFGAVLIGATLAFGKDTPSGHGADSGADHAGLPHGAPEAHAGEAPAAAQAHAHGSHFTFWLPFLSLRFWTFFLAAFGATGVLLWLASVHDAIGLVVALGNGFALGWAIAWVFEQLKVKPVSGMTSTRALIGLEAEVLLSVRPGGRGKIVVQTVSERIELAARTQDPRALEVGTRVLVASIADGVADVTAASPHAIPLRDRAD